MFVTLLGNTCDQPGLEIEKEISAPLCIEMASFSWYCQDVTRRPSKWDEIRISIAA